MTGSYLVALTATSRRWLLGLLLAAAVVVPRLFAQNTEGVYVILVDDNGDLWSNPDFHISTADDNRILLVNGSNKLQRFKFDPDLIDNPSDRCVRLESGKTKWIKPNTSLGRHPYTVCPELGCSDADCKGSAGTIIVDP